MKLNSNYNLGVLTGGDSLEAASSYTSADNVFDAIGEELYNRYLVEIKDGKWRLLKGCDLTEEDLDLFQFDFQHCGFVNQSQNERISFDAVIPMIHGRPAETGELQGYLESVGMPYTGSGVLASALTMSKEACKNLLSGGLDVSFPSHLLFESCQEVDIDGVEAALGYPAIVKPDAEGSGLGVALVHNSGELETALSSLENLHGKVLLEQYIEGVEITVAAVHDQSGWRILPIAEVERPEHGLSAADQQGIVTYKSRQNANLIIPAKLSKELNRKIQRATASIGNLLELKHYFRADFIMDKNNKIYFLEVNSIPGFGTKSVFTQQLLAGGLKMETLWTRILEGVMQGNS